ncbi:hypothetical protein MHB50_14985 [Siminovitchia sp. FSL H7-0308]|uniref:hypothetical protein n=1 Tax=unclassified Siminovitchia TaxID=2837530 RepID=UPI0030D238C3
MKKITLFSLLTMSVLLLAVPALAKETNDTNKPVKTAEKGVVASPTMLQVKS